MPSLVTLNVLRRFPIPTIRTYLLISATLLAVVLAHALHVVRTDVKWNEEFVSNVLNRSRANSGGGALASVELNGGDVGRNESDDGVRTELATTDDVERTLADGALLNTAFWMVDSTAFRLFYYTFSNTLCTWVVVNSVCCLVASFGNVLRWFVFGRLRVVEAQLRDRFWNFLFHKFVFVFGVLNVQDVEEVVLWALWFFAVGLFYLLTTLAQDRFKYMSSTAPSTSRSMQLRVVVLMGFCGVASLALFVASAFVCSRLGFNYGIFLAADALMLVLRSVYCAFRYGVYLMDGSSGGAVGVTTECAVEPALLDASWERRNSIIYYMELAFELAVSVIDGLHHVHMLVWSNIFLSMASLVMCMQLRSIYQDVEKRLRRHRNYRRILDHMDKHYPMTSAPELAEMDDDSCAICWDRMTSARKLPCGHYFHNWCLRGWLEQDTSCPTCRAVLEVTPSRAPPPQQPQVADAPLNGVGNNEVPNAADNANGTRRHFNHFFRFDGGRYARWLPSFSVEVTHNLGASAIFRRTIPESQLNTMAEQVREMFPQMATTVIMEDLRETYSAQATIENILDGRVGAGGALNADLDVSSGSEFEDDGSDFSVGEHDMSNSDILLADVVVPVHDDGQQPSTSMTTLPSIDPVVDDGRMTDTQHLQPSSSMEIDGTMHADNHSNTGDNFPTGTTIPQDERQQTLARWKRCLIERNRKKYLASSRAVDLRERYGYSQPTAAASNSASGSGC